MSVPPPDFELLAGGDDLDVARRERLRAVHDLLVAAGPPPEVPPSLRSADVQAPRAQRLHRRYRSTLLAAAAALGAAAFAGGYLVGSARDPETAFTVPMTGRNGERAEIVVYDRDDAGNWPMLLRVEAVTLREGAVYELWLTKDGRPAELCGSFRAVPGTTRVPMNAPYRFRDFDGWVIVPEGSRRPVLTTA